MLAIQLAGGPYGLLQAYAWAGMLVKYSKTNGVAQAVVDTFSGERPCELCCHIAKEKAEAAKKGESRQSPDLAAAAKLRFDFLSPTAIAVAAPAAADVAMQDFVRPVPVQGLGDTAPPVPPPREVV